MNALALLAVVALPTLGCFTKPPAPLVDDARPSDGDAGDDARRDANTEPTDPDAPVVSLCTIQDDFSANGLACGTWGTVIGAEVSRDFGKLFTKPTTSEAGCQTGSIVTRGIFSLHLDQAGLVADGDYVFFDLVWPGGPQIVTRINRVNGVDLLEATCNGAEVAAVYSANDHRHLRYVMSHSSGSVNVALIGSDGSTTATPLVNCSVPGVAALPAHVRFGTGTEAGTTDVASSWETLSFDCN